MTTRHDLIHSAVISFQYPSKGKAVRCNDLLENIFDVQLLPEIRKATDLAIPAFTTLEIEKLVINLGRIQEEDIFQNLGPKIRLALHAALEKSITDSFPFLHANKYAGSTIEERGVLEALAHFFQKGFLPSWLNQEISLDKLMDQALAFNRIHLNQMIRDISRHQEAKKRIAFGLDVAYFDRLIAVLEPTQAEWIFEYRKDLIPVLRKDRVFTSKPPDLEKSINYFILQFIVDDSSSQFSRERFSESILKQTSSHHNLDFELFIEKMALTINLVEQETVIFRDLKATLTSIQQRNKRAGNKTNTNDRFAKSYAIKKGVSETQKDKANDLRALLLYFLKGIAPSGSNEGMSPIQVMERLSPPEWQDFFRRLAPLVGLPEVNQRIAFDLPPKYFSDLLKVLEPKPDGWILAFRDLLIPVLTKEKAQSITQIEAEKSANLLLLKLIGKKRGSGRNKEAFSKAMLKDIAAHYRTDLRSLTNRLMSLNIDQFLDKSQDLVSLKEILASLHRAFNPPGETLIEKEPKKGARISEMNQIQTRDLEPLLLYFQKGAFPDGTDKTSSVATLLENRSPSHQKYFLERLSKIVGSTEINQRIAFGLPSGYFNDLLKTLEPSAASWIQTFRGLINVFFIKARKFDPYNEADEQAISLMILTTLRNKTGYHFDRKLFSERIIKDLITGYKIQIQPILDQLNTLLKNEKTDDPDLLLLRDALTNQLGRSQHSFSETKPINGKSGKIAGDVKGTRQDSIPNTFNGRDYVKAGSESISTKRKIIRYFLTSGSLPPNADSLGLHDIQLIFLELLKTGDPVLAELVREGSHPHLLLARIKQLLDETNISLFGEYANRRFDISVTWFFQDMVTDSSIADDATKPAYFYDYFLPALIRGKGDKNSLPLAFYKTAYHLERIKKGLPISEQPVLQHFPEALNILQYISFQNAFVPLRGSRRGRLLYDLFWVKRLRPFGIDLIIPKSTDKLQLRRSSYLPQMNSAIRAAFFLHLKSKKILERLYPLENVKGENHGFLKSQIAENQKRILRELIRYTRLSGEPTTINADKVRFHVKNLMDLHLIEKEFLLKLIQSDGKMGFQIIHLMRSFMYPREWKIFSKSLPGHLFSPEAWVALNHPVDTYRFALPAFDKGFFNDRQERSSGENLNGLIPPRIAEKTFEELVSATDGPSQDPQTFLRFWLDKGYLPWWSQWKTVLEILDDLSAPDHPLDKKEENDWSLLLTDSALLDRLLSEFQPSRLDMIFKKLTKRWAFRSVKKHFDKVKEAQKVREKPTAGTPDKRDLTEEQLNIYSATGLRKTEKDVWLKEYSKDPALLEKTVYHNDDRFLVDKFFPDNDKIKEQLEVLLSLTIYMYGGNLNGSKWRNMVFEFSLLYYKVGAGFSDKFYRDFLTYIRKKHAAYNWEAVLGLAYQKSLIPQNQIIFPKDFDTAFGLSRNYAEATIPEKSVQIGDQARIGNSGLVLVGPFLTPLFVKLGLLENGHFINDESQNRAAYLLQHLAFNHISFAEYDMVLNKTLTGIPAHVHLEPLTEVLESEKDLLESLLRGMLSNWSKLKNSSPAALQETFLQRDGVLTFEETSINLKVEPKGLDVLLDSVSWNFKLIKLPWMEKSVQVEWR